MVDASMRAYLDRYVYAVRLNVHRNPRVAKVIAGNDSSMAVDTGIASGYSCFASACRPFQEHRSVCIGIPYACLDSRIYVTPTSARDR